MSFHSKIAFSGFFFLVIGYANASPFDTGGVSLGITPAEARILVPKVFKPKNEGVITYTGTKQVGAYFATRGDIGGINAPLTTSVKEARDSFEIQGLFVGFSKNSQKAVTIVRNETYPEKKRPSPANLVAELIKKYGEPSFVQNDNYGKNYYWQYRSNGSPVRLDMFELNKCASQLIGRDAGGLVFFVPESFKSGCGKMVFAKYTHDSTSARLVQKLDITLIDHDEAYADLKKDADAESARNLQIEKDRLKQSEGVKVSL
jgi:hypothetical protein